MTVAANDIIRVTAKMVGPSGAIENVYQFRADVVILSSDVVVMTDLAQKLDDMYALIVDSLSSDTIFVEVQGYNVTQSAPMPTVSWPSLTAGTNSSTDTAAQVSGLALLRTGVSRVVGRKFIGGLFAGALDANGFLTSTTLTRIGAFAGSLVGAFLSTSLNSYLPGVKSTTSGLFWGFIEGLAEGVPATQRRRRSGRGI